MSKKLLNNKWKTLYRLIYVLSLVLSAQSTENYVTRQRYMCAMAVKTGALEADVENKDNELKEKRPQKETMKHLTAEEQNKEYKKWERENGIKFSEVKSHFRFYTRPIETYCAIRNYLISEEEKEKPTERCKEVKDQLTEEGEEINILFLYITEKYKVYHRGFGNNTVNFYPQFVESMFEFSKADMEEMISEKPVGLLTFDEINENRNVKQSCFNTEKFVRIVIRSDKSRGEPNRDYLICQREEKDLGEAKKRTAKYDAAAATALIVRDKKLWEEMEREKETREDDIKKSAASSLGDGEDLSKMSTINDFQSSVAGYSFDDFDDSQDEAALAESNQQDKTGKSGAGSVRRSDDSSRSGRDSYQSDNNEDSSVHGSSVFKSSSRILEQGVRDPNLNYYSVMQFFKPEHRLKNAKPVPYHMEPINDELFKKIKDISTEYMINEGCTLYFLKAASAEDPSQQDNKEYDWKKLISQSFDSFVGETPYGSINGSRKSKTHNSFRQSFQGNKSSLKDSGVYENPQRSKTRSGSSGVYDNPQRSKTRSRHSGMSSVLNHSANKSKRSGMSSVQSSKAMSRKDPGLSKKSIKGKTRQSSHASGEHAGSHRSQEGRTSSRKSKNSMSSRVSNRSSNGEKERASKNKSQVQESRRESKIRSKASSRGNELSSKRSQPSINESSFMNSSANSGRSMIDSKNYRTKSKADLRNDLGKSRDSVSRKSSNKSYRDSNMHTSRGNSLDSSKNIGNSSARSQRGSKKGSRRSSAQSQFKDSQYGDSNVYEDRLLLI